MKRTLLVLPLLFFMTGCSLFQNQNLRVQPGKIGNVVLLSNGWKLSPVGTHTEVGLMPLNMVLTKDGKYAITSNSGADRHTLSVIEIASRKEVQRLVIDKTFRGLFLNETDHELYASGGNNNCVYTYQFQDGRLQLRDSVLLSTVKKDRVSITGVAYDRVHNYLLAVTKENNAMYVINKSDKSIVKKLSMPAECFDIIVKKDNSFAYVSLWGGKSVAEINLQTLSMTRSFATGDHPCDIILSKDEHYLYSANANNNSVSVVDVVSGKTIETLVAALTPDAPYGSTPNSVCLSADGSRLLIANADNNSLAVFDVSTPGKSRSLGFIPTAWYPMVCRMTGDSKILVASAKGLSSLPNPKGPKPMEEEGRSPQYIAVLLKSVVSFIPFPDDVTLAQYSAQVYENTPYVHKRDLPVDQQVIPVQHNGVPSAAIKHIFYIVKENRTYDQVYGDLPQGNGDTSICVFGKKITPNQHKLTETFALFDNFYVDAEVSADGHNWTTAAYATDFVEKNWPVQYARKGGAYDYEGGVPVAAPSSGYIWTNVMKKGLSFRDYGEFVERVKTPVLHYEARDEDLKPVTCQDYPGFDLNISDLDRFSVWEKDFTKLENAGAVPAFSFIRLPNDHTYGSRKGMLTPLAYVAQNDYAVGKIIERISASPVWKESLIIILEDDAQNGSDHVDAHRSTLLLISPYIKHGMVDHGMYSTSGVLKTIELALGLQPMTQYDLGAMPLLAPFTDKADFAPFKSISPLIDIEQRNMANAYGAERCEQFNLAVEDAIPDIEFNEIIWKNIKGANAEMPAPVRGGFVKSIVDKDDD